MGLTIQTSQNTAAPANLWFPTNVASLSQRFELKHPREVIRWGLATYGNAVVLATGFGPSGIILMHLV